MIINICNQLQLQVTIHNTNNLYITKCIQVFLSSCWRSRDELMRDVLLWTPTHGRAKAGRPARTYIQQLCEDTGCCPEDLPRAMNEREEWRERVRDIRATSVTWWWWFLSKINNLIPIEDLQFHLISIVSFFFQRYGFRLFYLIFIFFKLNYLRHRLVWFGLVWWVLWHINLCRLFNAKSSFM